MEDYGRYKAAKRGELMHKLLTTTLPIAIVSVLSIAFFFMLTKQWRKRHGAGLFYGGRICIGAGSLLLLGFILPVVPFVGVILLFAGTVCIWLSYENLIKKFLWSLPLLVGVVLLFYSLGWAVWPLN